MVPDGGLFALTYKHFFSGIQKVALFVLLRLKRTKFRDELKLTIILTITLTRNERLGVS